MNMKKPLELSTLLDDVILVTKKFNEEICAIHMEDSLKDEYCKYLHSMADKIDKEWRKKND